MKKHNNHIMASNDSTITPFSICIPRVIQYVTEQQIRDVFNQFFESGEQDYVARVDMVERADSNTGEPFFLVFVHFTDQFWEIFAAPLAKDDEISYPQRPSLLLLSQGKEVKLTYDRHWFWKLRRNTSNQNNSKKATSTSRPKVMTDRDEQEFMEFQRRRAAIRAEQANASSDDNSLQKFLENSYTDCSLRVDASNARLPAEE
jgi:hypothetical protein|tara:strand:- start:147 stop:755 length:609 start_codon:yes stop_codon:yes gene_type:complete